MSEAFLKIVNMSISASYLVLAVLVLRLILKKAPKWVSVLLWGMVAVRLIFPISIESTLSLMPTADPIPDNVIAELHADVQTDAPVPVRPHSPADNTADMPVSEGTGGQDLAGVAVEEEPDIQTVTVLTALWLAGVAGMLVYTAVSYLLLRHRVATAIRLRNNIYRSENVDSPFVLGFLGPKIYLPFRMDSGDLPLVIAHEEAHIRRKDHWWKPIGFVLLSIHWFNPLMWIGYILLCRDIELACDEKVIREMDNETKADYTQALVSCSVNRRRIAACPLAFGEVGVKERVKTVMNYKKPAFWIVIAAVALCAVVAVSFLTNPKNYGPEVGNPKMLELPGVEWFVTPEELKEALNITEDQILEEYEETNRVTGYDKYWLYVTDLTLYGREVTYAQFGFKRDPGHDFAFENVVVAFADDTDMDALKADLTEIYGPGTDEPYSYYTYVGDHTRDFDLKLRMEQNLEYLAYTEGKEGNPYLDTLEDPEYMVHHWATKNGCDLIPEEVVEWFKYVMDRPWNADKTALQDDKVLMDMLDQFPWVAMTLSNRNAATIRRDTQGIESEFASHYSNNYLELSASMLANYLHKEDQMSDPGLLEYPGLKWGMTVDEAKSALNISDDMIIEEKAYGEEWRLILSGSEQFGVDAENILLRFCQYDDRTELYHVQVTYAEGTDMTAVRDNLAEIYGPGTDYGFTNYEIDNGTVRSFIDWNHTNSIQFDSSIEANAKNPKPTDEINHRWASTVGSEVFTEEEVDRFVRLFGDDVGTYADRETVLEYLEKTVKVTIACRDGYTRSTLEYRPAVTFNGRYISFNKAAYDAENPTEEATEEPTMSYDLPWLQYPDISWGMQPYQIKEILNVTEEQILVDEVTPGGYTLHIKDLTFLDDQLVSGQFNFLTTSVGQYLLTDITLYYPEETDMAAIRDDLVTFYGPANDGEGFTRYRMTDTATVEAYTDYGIVLPEALDGAGVNAWWQSEVVMANELVESEQNMLAYRAVLMNDHNEAFRDACLEYLKKESVNFICCTDSYDLTGSDNPYCTKNVVYMSAVDIITTLHK